MTIKVKERCMPVVKRIIKILLLAFWPAALLLDYQSVTNSSFSEWYATTIYVGISKVINTVTSVIPFSLSEILVVLLLIFFIVYLVWNIFVIIKRRGRIRTVIKFFYRAVALAGVLFFVFVSTAGVNYHRLTFTQVSGIQVTQYSAEELESLCYRLADDMNSYREHIESGEDKQAVYSGSLGKMEQLCKVAYDELEKDFETLISGYGHSKSLLSSKWFSQMQITGIFSPFTMEANVNKDVPDYQIPFTMCHELTHLRGYMREDEANFIAYIACMKSDDFMVQYSGVYMAFAYAGDELYKKDPVKYTNVYRTLSEEVKADLEYSTEYWSQFQGTAAQLAQEVNDAYLKANEQTEGTQSYGRMVDLLLAYENEF